MRALVTGGAGFIGSHVVDALLARGEDVTVLDNLDPRVHPARGTPPPAGAQFVRGDVRDGRALADALEGRPDVVFHEAAMVGVGRGAADAEEYVSVNVVGTLRLLASLARLPSPPRLVLASTMALYGEGRYRCQGCRADRVGRRRPEDLAAGRWEPRCPECGTDLEPAPVDEDHPPEPATGYAVTKLAQERLALSVGRELGLAVVALRYHNVYGPRMPRDTPYAGVASLFKSRALAGLPPLVHEDGRQLRDFIHVSDVARANLLAADAEPSAVAGEAFNVGTGRPRPIWDLAAALAASVDPALEPRLSGSHRPGDARHVYASVEKARRVLGFEAEVGFDEGVRAFLTDPVREPPEARVA